MIGLEPPKAVIKYWNQLLDLFNPTSRIDRVISDRLEVMDYRAKTIEALKPVSDRALAKAYELDLKAIPKISEERVLVVSEEEMMLAIKGNMDTIYGLKLVYAST